jgi:hypothetical protein
VLGPLMTNATTRRWAPIMITATRCWPPTISRLHRVGPSDHGHGDMVLGPSIPEHGNTVLGNPIMITVTRCWDL